MFALASRVCLVLAFIRFISLNLQPDSIIAVYFTESKKILTGYLQINAETNEYILMRDGRIDVIGKNAWIVAECTQLINLFEQDA